MRYCLKCRPKSSSKRWEEEEEEVFDICQKCGKACINDEAIMKAPSKGVNSLLSRALSIFRIA
jgi:hypothetical protein